MPKEILTAKPDDFKVNDGWFHLMPILSAEDSNAMRKSIELVGVRQPISVLPDMTIVDGHQRWTLVKFNPNFPQDIPYEIENGLADAKEEKIIEYILIKNMERRHLTSWQKHEVYKNVKHMLTKQGVERSKEHLKRGAELPDVDETSQNLGRTRTVMAERFGIPEETQKLAKVIEDTEDFETKALLDRDEITQAEAWRRVRKTQGKPDKGKKKSNIYLIRRENLSWPQFLIIWGALGKRLFEEARAKPVIRNRVDFPEKREADAIDAESNKTWRPVPFKGWACVHNVVGGCWRCFPELGEGGYQRKTGAKKAEEIHIPVGREELSGFTVLPDRDMQACHKCDLWDNMNNNCRWEEGTTLPEGCKKLRHRR